MGFMDLFKKKEQAPAPEPPTPDEHVHDEEHVDDLGHEAAEPAQAPPWMRDKTLDTDAKNGWAQASQTAPAAPQATPGATSGAASELGASEPTSEAEAPEVSLPDIPTFSESDIEAAKAAAQQAPSQQSTQDASPSPSTQPFQPPESDSPDTTPQPPSPSGPTASAAAPAAAPPAEPTAPSPTPEQPAPEDSAQEFQPSPADDDSVDANAEWKPPKAEPARDEQQPAPSPDEMELPPLDEPEEPGAAPKDYVPLEQYQQLLADMRRAQKQLATVRTRIKGYTKHVTEQKQPYATFAEAVNVLQHELISMDNILLKPRGD